MTETTDRTESAEPTDQAIQGDQPDLIGDLEFIKRLDRIKVLLVDDQSNMLRTVENMLASICQFKRKRDSIFKARNGEEALRIVLNQIDEEEHHIDLILLDWNMPKMPGIEVLRTVRASEKQFIRDVPIIMITGEADSIDVQNAVYEGANAYLLKPFLIPDLRDRMNPLLRNHWSGRKISRAENRRTVIRYNLREHALDIRVEFADGEKKPAEARNISDNGLMVMMERTDGKEIKAIHVPVSNKTGAEPFVIKVFPFTRELEDQPERMNAGLWFKSGLDSEEIKTLWSEWVDVAKEKELSYRANW
jgi:two-component system chemotaxis response regulator CheY